MAQLFITYWRDIPSQITVKAGRKKAKRLLPERFQEAIDMAAMRSGAAGTDAYLLEWRRGEAVEVNGDLEAIADEKLQQLEQQFATKTVDELVKNYGYSQPAG